MAGNLNSLIHYHRNKMDDLMNSEDTELAHQLADGLLIDLIIIFARQAEVTDKQATKIGSILTDFKEMEKWYS